MHCFLHQNPDMKTRLVISLNSSPSCYGVMSLLVEREREIARLYICYLHFIFELWFPKCHQTSPCVTSTKKMLWSVILPPPSLWIYYVLTCCFEINHQRWKMKKFEEIISHSKTIEILAYIFRIRMSWDVWLLSPPGSPHGDSLFLRPASCWGLHRADSSHCQQTIGSWEACNVIN